LLCPEFRCGKSTPLPDVRTKGELPSGDFKCPECFTPMMIVLYVVWENEAGLHDTLGRIPTRADIR
jgi:hypothetical protein